MASSETEIANMALRHLGQSDEIASLTENSPAATTCNRFYDVARDELLRSFRWPFATRFVALALVEEDPTDEWGYSYRYPVDCWMVRRIIGDSRNPAKAHREKYWVGADSAGKLIYSDAEDAEIEYTYKETDVSKFDPDFTLALSYKIAALAAPSITGGDPFKLKELVLQMHTFALRSAQANALNEQELDEEQDSEFIRDR